MNWRRRDRPANGLRHAPTPGSRPRRGAALLLVLIALAVLTVMGSSTLMTSLEEIRAGRRRIGEARAQALAERGINEQLIAWPASRAALAVGASESAVLSPAIGDTAFITVVKLGASTYLVTSTARTNMGSVALEARRAVSLVVRKGSGTVTAGSAIIIRSQIDLPNAAGIVSGINTAPPGWTTCTTGANVPAVTYNASTPPTVHRNFTVLNGMSATTEAASTDTYDTLRTALVGQQTITLAGNVNPAPVGTATTCTPSESNWGEPLRGGGSVAGCQAHFPVIYRNGSLDLTSGRGQGILLVDGSLNIRGSFQWVGLILVRDALDLRGNATVMGGVYVKGQNGAASAVSGNATLTYSSCAVQQASSGLGALARISQRPWAGLY